MFKKGSPKPPGSGMQKGQKTKRSFEAIEIFRKHDFDPLDAVIKRLKEFGAHMDEKLYIESCLKVAKFKYAELRSIEHKFDPSELDDSTLLEETKRIVAEIEAGK